MPDQYEVAERQRAALLRGDRQVSRLVLDAYFQAWKTIRADLEVVTGQLAAARARGEEPSAAWLFQQDRLSTLKGQVAAEVAQIAARLGPFLTGEQARWVARATEDAAALLGVAAGGAAGRAGTVTAEFVRLNPGAVEGVIGFLSDGSPLQALLSELGPDAAARVGTALTQGVITGADVRTISRNVRRAFGGSLARALIISRTVVLQAYREASMQQYRANAEVVGSWTWLSARGPRTCGFCWAMHGSIHPLSTRMASHPACRCTMLPNLRHAPDTTPIERGPAVFADEDATLQRAVLGPAKYAAYTAGALALEQLPGFRIDPRWGRVGFERSLRAILGDEAKRYYGRAA